MRFPQVLVYESDGRLAAVLRPVCQQRRWSLREPRRADSCLGLLAQGGPAVLVLKLGNALVQEAELLERVSWLHPDTSAVAVTDLADEQVAGLMWDLGAAHVLMPPEPRDDLADVVVGLMTAAIGRQVRAEGKQASPPAVPHAKGDSP